MEKVDGVNPLGRLEDARQSQAVTGRSGVSCCDECLGSQTIFPFPCICTSRSTYARTRHSQCLCGILVPLVYIAQLPTNESLGERCTSLYKWLVPIKAFPADLLSMHINSLLLTPHSLLAIRTKKNKSLQPLCFCLIRLQHLPRQQLLESPNIHISPFPRHGKEVFAANSSLDARFDGLVEAVQADCIVVDGDC